MPFGDQEISISLDTTTHEGVRIVRDAGRGTEGVPALFRSWYHRMAVSRRTRTTRPRRSTATGSSSTRARSRPAIWAGLWPLWQWRGLRLKQLAPGFDEERRPEAA